MNQKDLMVVYALNFIGVPYKWGGNNPMAGLDCSGFLCEVLRSVGFITASDYTAQDLYGLCSKAGAHAVPEKGSCLFFGSSVYNITHCALAISKNFMIEAGGGGSTTNTIQDAIKQNAFVRIRPIKNRKDLIDSISLQGKYPNG